MLFQSRERHEDSARPHSNWELKIGHWLDAHQKTENAHRLPGPAMYVTSK